MILFDRDDTECMDNDTRVLILVIVDDTLWFQSKIGDEDTDDES